MLGGQGACACVILVYMNVSEMQLQSHLSSQPLMILAPWILLHVSWSIPWFHGSTLSDCLPLPCGVWGIGGAKLKATTFVSSTCSCFPIFPLLLTPQSYSTFESYLLGLLLNNNNSQVFQYGQTTGEHVHQFFIDPTKLCAFNIHHTKKKYYEYTSGQS